MHLLLQKETGVPVWPGKINSIRKVFSFLPGQERMIVLPKNYFYRLMMVLPLQAMPALPVVITRYVFYI
jgi:hypothetical protein